MLPRGLLTTGGHFMRGVLASRLPSTSYKQAVRSMFIQVETTPNPLTLKFLPGQKLLEGSRTYDFTSVSSAKVSPLALQLLRITGVKGIFFGENFVSVTKSSEDEDWALIKPDVFAIVMDYVQTGKPIITDAASNEPTDTSNIALFAHQEASCALSAILDTDDDTVAMIKELLESRIKPMVQEDGGDILYRGFDEGVVKLKLQGSCTGCPSSSVTLKAGIKNMMQFYVPEVKDVIEVTDEADDLVARELDKFETTLNKKSE